ncbi:hypothetical protein ACWDNI_17630, partial [Nocardia niigatensis]
MRERFRSSHGHGPLSTPGGCGSWKPEIDRPIRKWDLPEEAPRVMRVDAQAAFGRVAPLGLARDHTIASEELPQGRDLAMVSKDYPEINQHLREVMKRLGREMPAVMLSFGGLHTAGTGTGALAGATKELMALAIGIAVH